MNRVKDYYAVSRTGFTPEAKQAIRNAQHSHRDQRRQRRSQFIDSWNKIYSGEQSWDANPWVWCISLKRLESPCEQ